MDKKYIDCEELLKTHPFTRCGGPLTDYAEGYLDCVEDAKEVINKFPSADVVEVRHGHWVEVSWGDFDCCSVCGCPVERQQFKYYYCPKCGAMMDEKSAPDRDFSECN